MSLKLLESQNIVSGIPAIHSKVFDFRPDKKDITKSALTKCYQFPRFVFFCNFPKFRSIKTLDSWLPLNRKPPFYFYVLALHKKWSFPLRMSSVNATKSAGNCRLVTFTEEIFDRKLHFSCSVERECDHDLNNILPVRGVFEALWKVHDREFSSIIDVRKHVQHRWVDRALNTPLVVAYKALSLSFKIFIDN